MAHINDSKKKIPQTNYNIEISASQGISWLEYLEALIRKEHNLDEPPSEGSPRNTNGRTGWPPF